MPIRFNFEPDKHGEFFSKEAMEKLEQSVKDLSGSMKQFTDVIMHPADTGRLRDSISYVAGIDPADKDSDFTILGMAASESSYIEEGTAYLINRPRLFGSGYNSVQLQAEIENRMSDYLNRYFRHGIGNRPFVDPIFHPQPGKPSPFRYWDESLIDYGKRLEKTGLLDNPDARWIYQKEVFKLVVVIPIKHLIESVKGALHE